MNTTVLQFKDTLPNLTLIEITSQDVDLLTTAIRNKVKQAPMMFIGMQVVLDCRALEQENLTLPIAELNKFLSGEGLNLVALMSGNRSHRESAVAQGVGAIPVLAQIGERKKTRVTKTPATHDADNVGVEKQTDNKESSNHQQEPRKLSDSQPAAAAPVADNQLINHPVRSGQRVYSRGDLTIVGSVSAGAEVIADGNIHIYGSLRGRAMAGAQGNEDARIFCHKLEAELVSIAGNYKPNEEIDEAYRNKNVQISLEGEKICFLTL